VAMQGNIGKRSIITVSKLHYDGIRRELLSELGDFLADELQTAERDVVLYQGEIFRLTYSLRINPNDEPGKS
jgi:hypothetical protein